MKTRINPENINTKEYLDDLYSKPDYLGAGYDGARERLKLVVDGLGRFNKHLDVGCANGEFTKYYLEKYPDTKGFGMDISTEALKLARENCPQGVFTEDMPKGMDLIHCGEVIEHIEDPEAFVKRMYDSLNKGGMLVITTVNETASDYEEHLWKWDSKDVVGLLKDFKNVTAKSSFFNGHIMYIEAVK